MPDNGENNQQKPNFVSWPQKHLFWQEIRKLGTKYIIWANNFMNSEDISIFTSNYFYFPKSIWNAFLNSHILEYEKNRTVFKFDFINGFVLLYPILRGKKTLQLQLQYANCKIEFIWPWDFWFWLHFISNFYKLAGQVSVPCTLN